MKNDEMNTYNEKVSTSTAVQELLSVKDVDITYGKGAVTIRDISFSVQPGEVLAVVGESGSGKTSIIRALMGCISGDGYISKGRIQFDGTDITSLTNEEWRKYRGSSISMIFQDSGNALDQIMTIGKQMVEHIHRLTGKCAEAAEEEAKRLLQLVSLPSDILHRYPFELSGGQRQRLGIAMAMTVTPKLLLADEPTSALDTTTQAQIVEELLQLAKDNGTAIIVVTHNMGVAAHMADRIMVMKEGRMVDYDVKNIVLTEPKSVYTKKLLAAVPSLYGSRYI
ncbi:ABC transporter ATP-binding protein [uncultured Veillonella sp.]|uniref:ABC transporter ATP-binding protein n=1 Tax=uncultured Veillonella sp. TaxID=159268 RepID=UPI002595F87A|nr:ABC transporter ATP-binding protein [uncultured Veillonella sp.]